MHHQLKNSISFSGQLGHDVIGCLTGTNGEAVMLSDVGLIIVINKQEQDPHGQISTNNNKIISLPDQTSFVSKSLLFSNAINLNAKRLDENKKTASQNNQIAKFL